MRENVGTFAKETTLHGVKELYQSRNTTFIVLWVILLLSTIAAMVIEVAIAVNEYRDEPYVTSIESALADHFPPVLVLPPCWADPQKLEKYDISADDFLYLESLFPYSRKMYYMVNVVKNFDVSAPKRKLEKILDETTLDDLVLDITRSAETVIEPASAEGATVSVGVKKHLVIQGVGYLVKDSTVINIVSANFAETVILIHNHSITYPIPTGFLADTTNMVFVDDSAESRSPINSNELATGFSHDLKLTVKRMKRVSPKRRPCRKYSTQEYLNCKLDNLNRACIEGLPGGLGCVPYVPGKNQSETGYCSILDGSFACLSNYTAFAPRAEELTRKYCPLPCEQEMTDVSVTTLPSTFFSFIRIRYSCPAAVVVMKETFSYTWLSLVSNVGGVLSLFMGASVISLVQTIWYCCCFGHERERPITID